MKYGDFFSGFGGTAVGARDAGLELAFGVEYDPDLAAVYRRNLGDHVIVEDVIRLDVAQLPAVDVFHASPPCTNASVANANGAESPLDLAMAQAVVRYFAHHRPRIVTLENVYQYRNFESWHVIARGLLDAGYTYAFWHVNMADYGVPQTRKRMIVIARRDGVKPQLPDATHAENPQPGFFGTLRPWVSWYAAIEDMLHTLPDSQFAPWQLKRLPEELREAMLVSNAKTEFSDGVRDAQAPAFSVTSQHHGRARASVAGRVVKMTPRALARFQAFPDWYELPDNGRLAVTGIGNAVPPLFARRLYKSVKEQEA